MKSGSVFAGKFFGVMIARGASTTSPSGVKSVTVWYGGFWESA
jgi:hypothetical protein